MNSLRTQIEADLKKAMLEKNEVAKDALRMAKSELLNKEVELGRDLTLDEAVQVLQKGVKARRDAIEQFREGGRLESVAEEERQLAVLLPYLPKQLGEDETRAALIALRDELGLGSKKDMGKLMKELKARHEGIDGKLAAKLAGELLV
jgi:uncharacterized protein